MKAIILISTLLMGTSSLALAPPLRQAELETRARGLADELVPIVDDNNNRRQWVATYGEANKTNDGSPDSPTVDDNNNRRQWVATYGEANKTNDGFPESPTVDDNNNRRQWVATYGEANKTENPDSGSTVDYTSNRSDWVVEYKAYDHWLPTGPDYLDLGQLEKGYHAHLLAMQGSSSWVHSGVGLFKRIFRIQDS